MEGNKCFDERKVRKGDDKREQNGARKHEREKWAIANGEEAVGGRKSKRKSKKDMTKKKKETKKENETKRQEKKGKQGDNNERKKETKGVKKAEKR